MMTPNEIGNKRFDSSKRGFYASSDVDSYLSEVAAYVAQLMRDNTELKRRIEAAGQKLDDFEKDQEALGQALINAQRLADSIVRDAQRKAEVTISDAEIKAQQVREKVRGAIVGEQQEFLALKQQVADFRNQIMGLYKEQLEKILETPDEEALGLQKQQPQEEEAPAQPEQLEEQQPVAQQPEEQPTAPQTQPVSGRTAEIPRAENPVFATAPEPEEEAAATQEPAAQAAESDEPGVQLNLVYDEASGQYLPAGQKPARFADLKFGADYHIGDDDEDKSGGIFKKKK